MLKIWGWPLASAWSTASKAEPRLLRARQRPGQHVPAVPVQPGHQRQESAPHRHIPDIDAPHVAGPIHHLIPQQIQAHRVCGMRLAGMLARYHGLQIHEAHQADDAFGV